MSGKHRVAVVVGSLREHGFSSMTAKALVAVAPENLEFETLSIGQLPIYNQEVDDKDPLPEWKAFRQKLSGFDAVLFVTPEHNRSIPAALKNAIDVGSRPYGHSKWDGLPGAVVSVSPGAIAGFGANHHLRQMLVFLNVPAMQQPEAYIGGASKLFDEQGNVVSDDTNKFLRTIMDAFGKWVDANAKK